MSKPEMNGRSTKLPTSTTDRTYRASASLSIGLLFALAAMVVSCTPSARRIGADPEPVGPDSAVVSATLHSIAAEVAIRVDPRLLVGDPQRETPAEFTVSDPVLEQGRRQVTSALGLVVGDVSAHWPCLWSEGLPSPPGSPPRSIPSECSGFSGIRAVIMGRVIPDGSSGARIRVLEVLNYGLTISDVVLRRTAAGDWEVVSKEPRFHIRS